MAFAGLRKQINKANQYVSEKMGGAEGTKLDDEFTEMERKTDVTNELIEELQVKTREFLHPNPASRAKMSAVKGISKLSGQAKAATYPQPEGVLGDCMVNFGRKLGDEEPFAQAMIETGEAMKQIADIKYALDDNMKQNFLEPLHHLQSKDLKEVMHHRKKLQGRRLDYDCKKRKRDRGTNIPDEEIRIAEDKFAESLHLAQMSMHNLLENDVEQISQLATFTESLLEHHRQCADILSALQETLQEKKNEAASRARPEFRPKTLADLGIQSNATYQPDGTNGALSSGSAPSGSPLPSPMRSPARTPNPQNPCAQALFDFEPENPGELGFKEGDNITLTQQIDENWLEGTLDGRTGYFPTTYVQVLVPLPR
ncbi:endophilin-A-like isoform X16 [Amphibalanus amphitrite]|nr:endophilin-A-like isoform X6 [Amphibalanus amphitrite]XP_043203047.1 endophilin-A-like isoform X6 [Amphibalanus amphitrite]XP_043203048.1 endophilin-A-like isoform X6 [Amphibalanus amphitrite]XP_043203049.1 endophilin-A-like isoform X6 [Amphibalanus amphitrite]XP_043214342.1 endophilin-A-like isoform X16 [Amphibalanus amphitrite]XP_043214343.1 endophilin-A-like isoform X16 [Amphibalanus amphitrite]XP_043214344.1 endophilin-A-like isoform X16 [Amphibalanus amphitrite]